MTFTENKESKKTRAAIFKMLKEKSQLGMAYITKIIQKQRKQDVFKYTTHEKVHPSTFRH